MESTERAEFEALYGKYLTWKSSQSNQTSGYEYESSFALFCEDFNKSLFELSLESPSIEVKKKSLPDTVK
jgi:hypothetical protein